MRIGYGVNYKINLRKAHEVGRAIPVMIKAMTQPPIRHRVTGP